MRTSSANKVIMSYLLIFLCFYTILNVAVWACAHVAILVAELAHIFL